MQFKTGFHFAGAGVHGERLAEAADRCCSSRQKESCFEQTRYLKPITISVPHLKTGCWLVLRQLGHTWQIVIASQMQEKASAILRPTLIQVGEYK